MREEHWFIVNPESGNGRGQSAWNAIKHMIERDIRCYKTFLIHEHFQTELEKYKLQAPARIWILGGDGTIHQTINTIFAIFFNNEEIPPISIIPAGSGNDFARALHIPLKPKDAYNQARLGHIHSIDLLSLSWSELNEVRYALTVSSVGFDSEVAAKFSSFYLKPLLNRFNMSRLAYYLTIIQTILSYQSQRVVVTVDKINYSFNDVWLVAVANLPYYGCGLPIAPQARAYDSQLDLIIIHGCNKWLFPSIFYQLIKGNHIKHKNVTTLVGNNVVITPTKQSIAQADGEILGTTPLVVKILPKKLNIFF